MKARRIKVCATSTAMWWCLIAGCDRLDTTTPSPSENPATSATTAPSPDSKTHARLAELSKERRFRQLELDETVNARQRHDEYPLGQKSYHERRQELDDRLADRRRFDAELSELKVALQTPHPYGQSHAKMLARKSELEAVVQVNDQRVGELARELGESSTKHQEPRVLEEKARRLRARIEAVDAEIEKASARGE